MTRDISFPEWDPDIFRIIEWVTFRYPIKYIDNQDYHAGGTFGEVKKIRISTEIYEDRNSGVTAVQPVESDGRVMVFSMPFMKPYSQNQSFRWQSVDDALDGHERIYDFLNRRYNGETEPNGFVDFDTGEPIEIPRILV